MLITHITTTTATTTITTAPTTNTSLLNTSNSSLLNTSNSSLRTAFKRAVADNIDHKMIIYPGPPKKVKTGKKAKIDTSPAPGVLDKHVINELSNRIQVSSKVADKLCIMKASVFKVNDPINKFTKISFSKNKQKKL